MKPKIYVETSVISYLSASRSQDSVTEARRRVTVDWRRYTADRFLLVASQFVVDEAGKGNPNAAHLRLQVLRDMELLEVTQDVNGLAQELLNQGAVPRKASMDAGHIAIAVVHRADFLVTWNLRHIANLEMQSSIDSVCLNAGYEPVVICTPRTMMEVHNANIAR